MQNQIKIEDICNILEISPNSYGLHGNMQKEEAEIALQDFKGIVKKQHRVLAKKYHPDLPSSGESELAKMKEINSTIDLIMKLKITRVAPKSQNIHFIRRQGFGGMTWSNNSSSTSSSNFNEFKFYRY